MEITSEKDELVQTKQKYNNDINNYSYKIRLKPDDADLYFERGNNYYNVARFEDSILDYDEAIKLNSSNPRYFMNRGNSYYQLEKYEESIADFTNAIELNSNDADYFINRGNAYYAVKKYENSIQDYSRAIDLRPMDEVPFNLRGGVYYTTRKYDESLKDLKLAIKLNPKQSDFYINMGNVYYGLNQKNEAYKNFEKGIRLNPSQTLNTKFVPHSQNSDVDKAYYLNYVYSFLKGVNTLLYQTAVQHRIPNSLRKITLQYYLEAFKMDTDNKYRILFNIFVSVPENTNISNKFVDHSQLINYLIDVTDFLGESEIKEDELEELYFQYSTQKVLSDITKTSKDTTGFTIRLYNSDYMNDPNEGKYLIKDESLPNQVCQNVKNSNIYLASLSEIKPSDERSLPMWNTYGEEHQGICMGLSVIKKTKVRDSSVKNIDVQSHALKDTPFNNSSNDVNHIDTGIYKVIYESDNQDQPNLDEIVSRIRASYKKIVADSSLSGYRSVIDAYLDKIRFLYKSGIYSYENEIRIIKELVTYDDATYDENDVKLFTTIQSDDEIEINLRKVSFGTKFKNYYYWPHRISKELNKGGEKNILFEKIDFPYR